MEITIPDFEEPFKLSIDNYGSKSDPEDDVPTYYVRLSIQTEDDSWIWASANSDSLQEAINEVVEAEFSPSDIEEMNFED